YHQIPVKAAALLGLAGAAAALLTRPASRLGAAAALALALGYAGYGVSKAARPLRDGREDPNLPLKRALLEHTRPGDEVMVISTSVIPTFPTLLQLERRSGSRYLWNF